MRSLKSIAAVLASTGVLISFSCAIPDLEKKPKETDEGTPLPAESVAVLPSSTINPEP